MLGVPFVPALPRVRWSMAGTLAVDRAADYPGIQLDAAPDRETVKSRAREFRHGTETCSPVLPAPGAQGLLAVHARTRPARAQTRSPPSARACALRAHAHFSHQRACWRLYQPRSCLLGIGTSSHPNGAISSWLILLVCRRSQSGLPRARATSYRQLVKQQSRRRSHFRAHYCCDACSAALHTIR